MTRNPDFLDFVIMQSLCLSEEFDDAFTVTYEHGQVTVQWNPRVADLVDRWVLEDAWFEVASTPLTCEVVDVWGPEWGAEAEVGTEAVIAERVEGLRTLLEQGTWVIPDTPPARIVASEVDLVALAQVL